MKGPSISEFTVSLVCPLCEVHNLEARDQSSAHCDSCRGIVSEAMLEALRQITDLPDALGSHACECGHPEMRRLPDGTRHCPSCGSEVVPIEAQATPSEHSEAWWAGWMDAHSGETGSFVCNPSLANREAPSERLDYYRGHRAGSEVRRAGSASLLARARKVEP